jgi:hypothetical protein
MRQIKASAVSGLKHQHRIERLSPGIALPLLGCKPDYRLDIGTKTLKGNKGLERLDGSPLALIASRHLSRS